MKKAVTVLAIFFCTVILFFTFFGETLFYESKPQVTTQTTYTVMNESGQFKPLPKECLVDGGYVYVVTYTQGFSAEITIAEKREIKYIDLSETEIGVTEGLRNGEHIIISSDREFKDGDMVTVTESGSNSLLTG